VTSKSARPDVHSPLLAEAEHRGRRRRNELERGAKIGQSKMSGSKCPACDFQKVARTDWYERILDVVGSRRNPNSGSQELAQAREAAGRQLLRLAAL
jgi:hypothetical protein